jgi:hypothetical protein
MSRRQHQPPAEGAAEIGLAWYTREAWQRLRELAADVDTLDDTYEDWERGALRAIRELEAVGRRPRKVPIDVDLLARWCQERHRPLDSGARAEYVTYLLQASADVLAPNPPRA